MWMYTCTMKIKKVWCKVKGSTTRCTPVRSAKRKGVERMDTYLETNATKFSSNWEKLLQGNDEILNTGSLKLHRRFWRVKDFSISKKISESWLDEVTLNWEVGREWIGSGGKLVQGMYWAKSSKCHHISTVAAEKVDQTKCAHDWTQVNHSTSTSIYSGPKKLRPRGRKRPPPRSAKLPCCHGGGGALHS